MATERSATAAIAPSYPFGEDAEFRESEHPRDPGGKFTEGGGGSAAGGEAEGEPSQPAQAQTQHFKTKKDHAEHLLKKGVTTKEMLTALGWPSISMPAMAKSLNMRLEKIREGGVTRYVGHSLGPRSQPEKTHSLIPFLAKRGGIRNDDGNISDLRAAIGAGNKFIPGFGQLIRQPRKLSTAQLVGGGTKAMSLDTAREAAAEAGYIPETTTLPEFIEMLDSELRGNRIYPEGYTPPGRSDDPAQLEHEREGFMAELHQSAPDLTARESSRAAELWGKEGLNDSIEILERIALETDDAEIAAGGPIRTERIPGWDADIPF